MNAILLVFTTCATQSCSTNFSEEDSTIVAAIIAVAGVVIGAILTLSAQLLLNSIENKRDKEKQVYEKQIEIYPIALEYIIFYAQLQEKIKNRENAETINAMSELEKEKYVQFYYVFSLISSSKTTQGFNDLRKRIESERISPEKAYEELVDLLKNEN